MRFSLSVNGRYQDKLYNSAGLRAHVQLARFGAITRLGALTKRLRTVPIDKPAALTTLSHLSMREETSVFENGGKKLERSWDNARRGSRLGTKFQPSVPRFLQSGCRLFSDAFGLKLWGFVSAR